MTRLIIALLAVCVLSGIARAAVLSVDVKTYDFNSIVVSGRGTGTASLAIDGKVVATKDVAGDYELVARGLQAGCVYVYDVNLGEDSTRGEVAMGARTGTVFGANATTGVDLTTGGAWNSGTPHAQPGVVGDAYDLQGIRALFDLASELCSKIVCVDSTMTFLDGMDELDPSLCAFGAFTLAQTNETSVTDYFWAGLAGGRDRWVNLTGMTPEPGTYVSRMEFDLNDANAVKVRYSLKKADGDQPLVVLSRQGVEWFPVASETSRIGAVAYEGTGRLAAFEGSTLSVDVAEVDGVRYSSLDAALAAAGSNPVKLLWDCTWTPCVRGRWTLTPDGKTLVVASVDGWESEYDGNVLCASNVKVARVGSAEYYFLTKAFADGGDIVTLLANAVESGDISFTGAKVLDLAGKYLSGTGRLVSSDGATLVITNSTGVSGGFDMGFGDGLSATVKGGKWRTDSGRLGDGYRFMELAESETVDGATYAYEAVATSEDRPAKVYPVSGMGHGESAEAVVADEFVAQHVADAATKTAAQIAAALNTPRTTGNGLPLVQSYILGLDPDDEAARPVVVSTQVAAPDKVGVSLGNVSVNEKAGVKVSYSLSTSTSPDFESVSTSERQASPSFEAAVPPVTGTNVKYYRINVHLGSE